jgi:K+-sensing histidine kinase KdpD
VLITVEDSGTGIDPQNLDRIFDRFFTTKSQGMGMGLSICRSIIESHDGHLSVVPAETHGSIFHVSLPTSIIPPRTLTNEGQNMSRFLAQSGLIRRASFRYDACRFSSSLLSS